MVTKTNPTFCPTCGSEMLPETSCGACLLKLGRNAANNNRGWQSPGAYEPTSDHVGSDGPPNAAPSPRYPRLQDLSENEIADRFPQFDSISLIGRGGMGTVFRARQRSLDRAVAIKVIQDNQNDPAFAERFAREARALARLSHPNIVTIHDFGSMNDMYYLVMEYIDGVNLRQAIDARAFDPSDALRIIEQVCRALQYAHSRGVVHRDIKPENILLTEDGTVKIADFGLAKLVDENRREVTLTSTRQVMGTVAYMAPEQIDNTTSVDHRADIYSLGVVFYELLTGHLPLGRFELPSQRVNGVDGRIDPVVMKTLSRSPDERYQSALELGTEISKISQQPLPVPPHKVAPPSKAAQSPAYAAIPGRSDSPSLVDSISFSINEVHGGFAEGQGIVQFEPHQITFEWKVKDSLFGAIQSDLKQLVLPIDQLSKLTLYDYWITARLEIGGRTLRSLDPLPQHKLGTVTLAISASDTDTIRRWIEIYRSNGNLPDPHANRQSNSSSWIGSIEKGPRNLGTTLPILALCIIFVGLVMGLIAMKRAYKSDSPVIQSFDIEAEMPITATTDAQSTSNANDVDSPPVAADTPVTPDAPIAPNSPDAPDASDATKE